MKRQLEALSQASILLMCLGKQEMLTKVSVSHEGALDDHPGSDLAPLGRCKHFGSQSAATSSQSVSFLSLHIQNNFC